MKILYLECGMGAAGDMLMSSLLELIPNVDEFVERLNNIGIPNVEIKRTSVTKCGIIGTGVNVIIGGVEEDEHLHDHAHEHGHSHDHNHSHEQAHNHEQNQSYEQDQSHAHNHSHDYNHSHEQDHSHDHTHDHAHNHTHQHTGMKEVCEIINTLNVEDKVKSDALAVYKLIADAESHAHGVEVDQIHFHEVGTMDAVVDIVGVCMLMNEIAADKVYASSVHVGCGQVRCAHGILPVPAPATAHILQGVPTYGGEIKGELCTPTGAALLKYFVDEFKDGYSMSVSKTGYGMGKRDFTDKSGTPVLSSVRAMLGESSDSNDKIYMLCCNIDDMTAEQIAFATECLFEGGALDVYTTSIGMKKNRPGTLISCMCRENDRQKIVKLLFKHTTTIGVREFVADRYILDRCEYVKDTKYGKVHVKKSSGYGVVKEKPEYEDLARLARENDLSLFTITD